MREEVTEILALATGEGIEEFPKEGEPGFFGVVVAMLKRGVVQPPGQDVNVTRCDHGELRREL